MDATYMESKLKEIFMSLEIAYPSNDFIHLAECGANSVNFVNIIVGLETEFNMEIPDEEILFENFKNLALIKKKIMTNAASVQS
ncbi:hypothetical protein PaecuDRAFT_3533 [Paenibacillus curdlanolyticus YK9]|uniref:Carrier domain-containing protein n=1 Tax=Paenibacillus curdlanolyticus YK9 TaxID=717606 RepID=E0ID31_9BACL|nr:phosphopantetheine-binding protein [Paenibacillus curdlanolyticus]EFM09486.1 hypothetical protein PaecuDRAFT_3533 [Paenibacillus curdlanolyticus YK9]